VNDAEKAMVDRRRKMKAVLRSGKDGEVDDDGADKQADEIAEAFTGVSMSSGKKGKEKGKK